MKKRMLVLLIAVLTMFSLVQPVSAAMICYGWAVCGYSLSDFVDIGTPFLYKDWQVSYSLDEVEQAINYDNVEYKLDGERIYYGYIFTEKDTDKELTATYKGRTTGAVKLKCASDYYPQKLTLAHKPDKMTYAVGEKFDPTGFELEYYKSYVDKYNDELIEYTETLGPDDVTFQAWTQIVTKWGKSDKAEWTMSNGYAFAVPGKYRVVASFKSDHQKNLWSNDVLLYGVSFVVTVTDGKSLVVDTPPSKTEYVVGEPFETAGFAATYFNKDEETSLTADDVQFTAGSVIYDGRPFQQAGEKKVTVKYKDKTASFNIVVNTDLVSTEMTPPNKNIYYVGDPFDTTGFSLTINTLNGSETVEGKDVKFTAGSVIYDGRPFQQAGNKTVVMTYKSASAKFEILVKPASEKPVSEPPAPEPPVSEPPAQITKQALSSAAKVIVNEKSVAFDAYNIDGNNFFKLRDLAYALSGCSKQFEVGWDAGKNAINLTSGKSYTSVGGELAAGDKTTKNALLTTSAIYKDGVQIALTAYNINGNNYFKLRDIAKAFDIGVTWDASTSTVGIDATVGYTE